MSDALGIKISQNFIFKDEFKFDFSSEKPVPISDLIRHLEGLQGLCTKLPSTMQKLYEACGLTGIKVSLVDVHIEKMEHGSLVDDIVVILKLFFAEEQLEKLKHMNPKIKIAALLGGLTIGTIFSLKSCVTPDSITNRDGLVQLLAINIGSTLQLPYEKIKPILDAPKKKVTAKEKRDTVNFYCPSTRNCGSVVISGDATLSIPQNVIEQIPLEYEPETVIEHVENLKDTDIVIRAMDADSAEKGWRGIIEAVHPTMRIPLELDPEIDRDIRPCRKLQADIEVFYKAYADGTKKIMKAKIIAIKKHSKEYN